MFPKMLIRVRVSRVLMEVVLLLEEVVIRVVAAVVVADVVVLVVQIRPDDASNI